ncbi:hypothetical protein AM438_11370 [Proteus mirabilis]|nr:hypothetical protein AM438_11370 [Proteus mirabilis]HAU5758777.1 hypothetical protein [Proteus mirabilis]
MYTALILPAKPEDYWYDYGIIESTKILNLFTDSDWVSLLDHSSDKSIYWKVRLVMSHFITSYCYKCNIF